MKAIPPLIGFGMLLIAISYWAWLSYTPYRHGYEQRRTTDGYIIWVLKEPPQAAVTDTVYLDAPALDEEGQ